MWHSIACCVQDDIASDCVFDYLHCRCRWIRSQFSLVDWRCGVQVNDQLSRLQSHPLQLQLQRELHLQLQSQSPFQLQLQ